MSSRRSRQPGVPRITDAQIIDLVSKLQHLLPEIRDRRSNKVRTSWSRRSSGKPNMLYIFHAKYGLHIKKI